MTSFAEVEAEIQSYYQALATGRYADAIARMAPGMKVYAPSGLLQVVPVDKEAVLAVYQQSHEQGFRRIMTPYYMDGTVHGDVAVATFLTVGLAADPGQSVPEEVLERVTHVWVMVCDKWLLSHTHVSVMAVRGRDKPATQGRVKTGHF